MEIERRAFIGAGAASLLAPGLLAAKPASPILQPLSAFVSDFMAARNAPGMIVGMADAKGWFETERYGFADLEAKRRIGPGERFHIGSLSKAFTALLILQLVEEKKLRLDAEIRTYIPELPLKMPFGPITIHHMLCHGAGIASVGPAPGWPNQTVEQTFAPGSRSYYSNLTYEWLGKLIVVQGGEPWGKALRRRVLDPLGMTDTSTMIGPGMRHLEVPSYSRLEDDRPFTRMGPLTRAAPLTFTGASGSIATTAADMIKYIMMLVRRGQGPKGRLLSAESFALMTRHHIDAPEFGPGAGYGYGWVTDRLDGKPVIRHTGGMESFMSTIHVDLEAGFGAFASINAQQHYRPNPITVYAVQLYRANAAKAPPPEKPSSDPDADLRIADYAADYFHADGRQISVRVRGKQLHCAMDGKSLILESLGNDKFACRQPGYRLLTFLFTRASSDPSQGKPGSVVALSWARDSYVRRGAALPPPVQTDRVKLLPNELQSYEGYYAMGNGWTTSVRILARDGRLWMDLPEDIVSLTHLGEGRFQFAQEAASPDVVEFSSASIEPRALALWGTALTRLGDPFFETV